MHALYRKPIALPSLILLLSACGDDSPPRPAAAPISDTYLEALQKVESLKHSLEEHDLEQQGINGLLGPNQPSTR